MAKGSSVVGLYGVNSTDRDGAWDQGLEETRSWFAGNKPSGLPCPISDPRPRGQAQRQVTDLEAGH